MPSPVMKRPATAREVPGESQNSGNPRSAANRVAASRTAAGRVCANLLLAIRPTSIAAKNAVREVAAAGRARPVPSARKSAPQYPTHHSEATPSATSAQNDQYSGGRVASSAGASSFAGGSSGREKQRAASSTRATTGKTSAARQPSPEAAVAPTSSGAAI